MSNEKRNLTLTLEEAFKEFGQILSESVEEEMWENYPQMMLENELNKIKTMSNEKRTLALTLAEARKLYAEGPSKVDSILKLMFTKEELEGKDELPTWEELQNSGLYGYFISNDSKIIPLTSMGNNIVEYRGRNTFATESQARSALAMAQLSQLMKALGDECKVDWSDNEPKYIINRKRKELYTTWDRMYYYFLAFKTASVRDAFLKKHEDLIKQYFEL